MRYKILKDGEVINTIVSDEEFCSAYCEENGYTYELEPEQESESELEPEPTAQDDTDAMLVDHEYRLTLLELGVMEEV